jgi:hypothetical protein
VDWSEEQCEQAVRRLKDDPDHEVETDTGDGWRPGQPAKPLGRPLVGKDGTEVPEDDPRLPF